MATRKGYGQVERQHMAAPHNGQIYAQLPALDASGNAITQLENERRQNHKDFVMKASDMSDGKIYPRLLRTFVGDIFTTNTFRTASTTSGNSKTYGNTVTGPDDTITIPNIAIGDYVVINDEGWLEGVGSTLPETTGIIFQAVPHFTQMGMAVADRPAYTLPDKQWAVKLQRIQ